MKQEWQFLVAFEQKERLVFRNSGFRLVSDCRGNASRFFQAS